MLSRAHSRYSLGEIGGERLLKTPWGYSDQGRGDVPGKDGSHQPFTRRVSPLLLQDIRVRGRGNRGVVTSITGQGGKAYDVAGNTSGEHAAEMVHRRGTPASKYDEIGPVLSCHLDYFVGGIAKALDEFYVRLGKSKTVSLQESRRRMEHLGRMSALLAGRELRAELPHPPRLHQGRGGIVGKRDDREQNEMRPRSGPLEEFARGSQRVLCLRGEIRIHAEYNAFVHKDSRLPRST